MPQNFDVALLLIGVVLFAIGVLGGGTGFGFTISAVTNIPRLILGGLGIIFIAVSLVRLDIFPAKLRKLVGIISAVILVVGLSAAIFLTPKPETDALVGVWTGTAKNGDVSMEVTFSISESCQVGTICGTFNLPTIPCSGTFTILSVRNKAFEFRADNKQGECGQADSDTLQLLPDDTLLYVSKGEFGETRGILHRAN